uniref:Uncharacterized protein n=1 Tax=Meloidogyne enterolobii TaxID=390850 RepID=A0A6V7WTW7_MELEN|nr:unnamed protein product [Meloidogyne enterolobii]
MELVLWLSQIRAILKYLFIDFLEIIALKMIAENVNGFWKACADCDYFELGNMVNGMGDDCTCYQCNTDYCNSAFGVVSNIKIIALLCWIILILSFI